jgi:hypothetical protein
MVVLMNINDELALHLFYIFGCLIQDYMFNRNMERPPRTTVQPQELYGSGLGRVIREVFVWLLLA